MKVQSRETGKFLIQEMKFMDNYLRKSTEKLLNFYAKEKAAKLAASKNHNNPSIYERNNTMHKSL